MNRLLSFIPEAQGEEFVMLEQLTNYMDDDQLRQFATVYRSRRRDPQNVLIFSVIGLFVLPGLQRFYLGQIGWGILYFFTAGLCLIGSTIDLINHKSMAQEYNQKIADEVVRRV
jgi:TM2 domain-containing membrane protein YozV